ncbi:MAG: peptidoglycan editing factor PgeF [Nitrospirota bacterium]
MNRLIIPDIFKSHVTGFFTGKNPGADPGDISRILKINRKNIYMPVQQHTDKIVIIESSQEPKIADAVITREKGILIGIQIADCVPILLYEKEKGVSGAVHAGWRGTAERIIEKTIRTIMEKFMSSPENILVAIGPGIRWCCYGVDHDVFKKVQQATGQGEYSISRGGKYCLDLPSANKYQALSTGIPESNIWISDECTFCNPDKYYSYRYSKGPTGRQGGFIGKIV